VVLKDNLHLSPESTIYRPYRTLLRFKAMERLDRLNAGDAYNYSVLFTADEEVRRRVQARFLEFLKDVQDDIQAAPAQEVYQLSFDLFRWSDSAGGG
jgi:hypothetical protein